MNETDVMKLNPIIVRLYGLAIMVGFGCFLSGLPVMAQTNYSRSERCAQLEQQLGQEWVRGNQSANQLPELRQRVRKQDHIYHAAQAKAERADCYESMLLFGRALRRTKRCLKLHKKIETSRQQLGQLKAQLEALKRSQSSPNQQNRLLDALARNGCGQGYQQEARRRRKPNLFDFFGNNDFYEEPRQPEEKSSKILSFATYRTMCVRLCDGYYYPISFSTLPRRFAEDADVCASNCSTPAELYVYRNPGEEVQQMVSLSGTPYGQLPNAWLYRKKYIRGCSCKQVEYSPIGQFDDEKQSGWNPTTSPAQGKKTAKENFLKQQNSRSSKVRSPTHE